MRRSRTSNLILQSQHHILVDSNVLPFLREPDFSSGWTSPKRGGFETEPRKTPNVVATHPDKGARPGMVISEGRGVLAVILSLLKTHYLAHAADKKIVFF